MQDDVIILYRYTYKSRDCNIIVLVFIQKVTSLFERTVSILYYDSVMKGFYFLILIHIRITSNDFLLHFCFAVTQEYFGNDDNN